MTDARLQRVRAVPGTDSAVATGNRLVVWPHAGGVPAAFGALAAGLPEFEVWGVVPPGRGMLPGEEPVVDPDLAVAGALAAVDALPAGPGRLVVLGHSLGGAMAARLAARLGDRCDLLVVSGWPGPGAVPPAPVGAPADRLGPAELMDFLDRLDAPGRVDLRDPEFQALLFPRLLADLRMGDRVAGLAHVSTAVPMVTVAGRTDPAFTVVDVQRWSDAEEVVESVVLDGGHFALLSDVEAVAAAIRRAVSVFPVWHP